MQISAEFSRMSHECFGNAARSVVRVRDGEQVSCTGTGLDERWVKFDPALRQGDCG